MKIIIHETEYGDEFREDGVVARLLDSHEFAGWEHVPDKYTRAIALLDVVDMVASAASIPHVGHKMISGNMTIYYLDVDFVTSV